MEYAARLMVGLASSYGQQAVAAERLSASEAVPVGYVNQLLLRLKRAGLVSSHRGSGGGYALSRPPAEVTLGQVLRAVEGGIFEDVCEKYAGAERDCQHQARCGISPVWQKLGEMIEGYFDGITLAQLLRERGACDRVEAMLGGLTSRSHDKESV